jgi:hypothetical protein
MPIVIRIKEGIGHRNILIIPLEGKLITAGTKDKKTTGNQG